MGLIDQSHGWDPEAPGYLVLVSGGVDGLTIETERPLMPPRTMTLPPLSPRG
jgi:hypothetical protein